MILFLRISRMIFRFEIFPRFFGDSMGMVVYIRAGTPAATPED